MSFAAILLMCVVVTAIMSVADRFYFSNSKYKGMWIGKVFEQGRSFLPVFLLVFCLRSFLVEPFRIPSSSLEPTLLVGDFLLVNKFSYGIRFPVVDKKLIKIADPERGDVVVFSWPPNKKFDYIKRVIGIPGDKISYHNKVLTINGIEAKQTFIKHTSFSDGAGKLQSVSLKQEKIGNVKHDIYVNPSIEAFDFEITVPAGNYFMMGDNRDYSSDSRYWGFVPNKNLRGKAFLIWMSWNNTLTNVRFSRIGSIIH